MYMLKRIAASLVLVTALVCAGPVLAADPTIHQVYQAVESGHLDQAQQLMNEVLRAHPNSAVAHYVEAEVSAKAANIPRAREELAKAQQLDPTNSFAKPQALAALQRELSRTSTAPPAYRNYPAQRAERHSSISWGVILLIVAGVAIVWALMSRRRPPQYGGGYVQPGGVPPAGGGYGAPPGYGPGGYGAPMGGGGLGGGIVGGLASGLALGAGVAAGGELVRHWIDRDGNRVEGAPPPGYVPPPDDNANMGGNDFGVSDNSSWDSGGGGGDFGTSDGGGGGGDDWT